MKTINHYSSESGRNSVAGFSPKTRSFALAFRALTALLLLAALAAGAGGITLERVFAFPGGAQGRLPGGTICQGTDGAFYGSTLYGGAGDGGVIYKINADGTGFSILRELDPLLDGSQPNGTLIEGSDMALYGTAQAGGDSGFGTVFKIQKDGSGFSVLHHFAYDDGSTPLSSLVRGSDGSLYGTANNGGTGTRGVVFRISEDGSAFGVLHHFAGDDGGNPVGGLFKGADGALYGAASQGGLAGLGTVYRLSEDSSGFTVLFHFDGLSGAFPYSDLAQDSAGLLYGTTVYGGGTDYGTVFKLKTDGTDFTVIHAFDGNDGAYPVGGLLASSDGMLYGTSTEGGSLGGGMIYSIADGVFSVIANMDPAQLSYSTAPIAGASDGILYGTVQRGGASGGGIFRLLRSDVNHPPRLAGLLEDQTTTYQSPFVYAMPANVFVDIDPGQTLTYSASGLPPGIVFDTAALVFSGLPTEVGSYLVTVTARDNGVPAASGFGQFRINVVPATQTISFPSLADVTWGEGPFTLRASASSGLPVSFEITSGPGTVAGDVLAVTGAGEVAVRAFQVGDTHYRPAPDVVRTFMVAKATPVLGWALPAKIVYGTVLGPDQLNATASVGGTFSYSPAAGSILAAGSQTLTVTFTPTDTANYNVAKASVLLGVERKGLVISVENAVKIYGETNPVFTSTMTGVVAGDRFTVNHSVAANETSPVGVYDIVPMLNDLDGRLANYSLTLQNGLLTVVPAPLTVRCDDQFRVYGESNPGLTGSVIGLRNSDAITALFTTVATAGSGAGTYPITATLADPAAKLGNYTVKVYDGSLRVGKAKLQITADAKSKVYAEPLPSLTVSYAGFVNGDTTTALAGNVEITTPASAGSAVGDYAIHLLPGTLAADNYEFQLHDSVLTVTRAALVIVADDKIKTYGDALPELTMTCHGLVNGDTANSLAHPVVLSTDALPSSGVGVYGIMVGGASDSNYTITFVPGKLTVVPAVLTVKADNQNKIYGAPMAILTASYSGFITGDDASVLTGYPELTTVATSASHVGSYVVTASLGSLKAENYSFNLVNGILRVTPAPLLITARSDSKVYGAAMPALEVTYRGFVNGDSSSSLASLPVLASDASLTSGAGDYIIAVSDAAASDYEISYLSGVLTVTKAPLTISADNATKIYGTINPPFATKYDGFVLGQGPQVLNGVLTMTCAASTASSVGQYSIVPSGLSSPNYSISNLPGALTILPARLVITAGNASKVYGQANPVFAASYSGFVNGDSASSLASPVVLTTDAGIKSGVGEYPIIASGGLDLNYSITYVNGLLKVTPAPLQVIADDATKQYSDPVPPLTAHYSGWVAGDDRSVLNGILLVSTSADSFSAPGTYPIVASGLSAKNYSIVYVPGQLVVKAEDARVTYTGPLNVSTKSANDGSAVVNLSVTVRDISAVAGDPGTDSFPGDIRRATVTFINRDDNSIIAANVPVGLIDPSDSTVGTAAYRWATTIGSASNARINVGFIVSGYYVRDDASDTVQIRISKRGSGSDSGHGTIIPSTSSGAISASAGTKVDFTLNGRMEVDGLHGSFAATFWNNGRRYSITSDALTSLINSAGSSSSTSEVTADAVLMDVTNAQPVVLDSRALLTVFIDSPQKGDDSVAISLFAQSGGGWFSSNWNGKRTISQSLSHGKMAVR